MAKKYSKGTEEFVNPYHFVPLGDRCDKNHSYSAIKAEDGLLTGWIECGLETKSPIFVPNATNDDVFGEKVKSYDFCSRDNISKCTNPPAPKYPVIPGSELRGMIRSAFKAVTNSCMSAMDDDEVLFKRATTPGQPGRIVRKDDEWYLQPCRERIGIAAWKKYGNKKPNSKDKNDFSDEIKDMDEAKNINFRKSTKKYTSKRGYPAFYFVESLEGDEKGFLHKGESIYNKHHESVFVPNPEQKRIPIDKSDLDNLLYNFKLYRDSKVNQSKAAKKHGGYAHIKADNIEDFDGALVYYKKIDSRIYLCPAAIGREVFHNRLKDLIGTFVPCEKLTELCPACALFGLVGKESASGRIRFGDAKLQTGQDVASSFLKPMFLPELASPKPSATEFYLKRPIVEKRKVDLWNYDYAGNWKDEKGRKIRIFEPTIGYPPEIQGRKFYWHGGTILNLEKKEEISDRNIKVRPLGKGVKFEFKIYFNEITPNELKKLLWVLTIGGSSDYGHKIGMGKPVGLGSVAVRAEDVKVRSVELSPETGIDYKIELEKSAIVSVVETGVDPGKAKELLGGDKKSIEAFLTITKFENGFKEKIDYPRLEQNPVPPVNNPNAIFHWFVGNKKIHQQDNKQRQGKRGNGTNPIIDQELPPLNNPKMKKIKCENQQKANNRR
jgi:CRISPR-associated protein (TIGR03986 family)